MTSKSGLFLVLIMSMALYLPGCGQKDHESGQRSGGASTDNSALKEYMVGSDASYAPFEFQSSDQSLHGFDVDLLTAVAAHAGFRVKFVNTPWEGIFTALEQGDRDVLASAITITDERKRSMDFSTPYFEARQLIAVPKSETQIKSFPDLKGKRVAVQTGTTGDEVVQKLLGKTSRDIKRFESMPLALKELENGGVDAVVGDNGVVSNYVANNPDHHLKTLSDTHSFAPEFYGFAVRKGDTELLSKLNAGIAAVKADGSYEEIYKKYFGSSN